VTAKVEHGINTDHGIRKGNAMTGTAGATQENGTAQLLLRLSALDLGAMPDSVPTARLHARAVLAAWGLRTMTDAAELVVSELVTNAVAAAAADASGAVPRAVRLRLSAAMAGNLITGLQVEVWDAAGSVPRQGRVAPLDEPGGWGLVLVEHLSERWGCYPVPDGGKVVWAVLAR
jgi:anti-sigma regulatory factor (Ser/Thr protein kinase)